MAGTSLTFEISGLKGVQALVFDMQAAGQDTQPLMLAIAQTQMQATQRRFKTQRAPSGAPWAPSKAAIRRADPGRPTLVDTRHFVGTTFSAEATGDTATWGTSAVQGRIFQFGGTIQKKARTGTVRLRQNADGSLMRQGDSGRLARLARFASNKHKRVREVDFTAGAHTINVIARPFLGLDNRDRHDIETLAVEHYLRRGAA